MCTAAAPILVGAAADAGRPCVRRLRLFFWHERRQTESFQEAQIQADDVAGVNFVGADSLLAALGDINRFKDGDHATAYLGTGAFHASVGKRCDHSSITKASGSHARWLLAQGVQHMGLYSGPPGVFVRRLAKRRNRNTAIVATARKLVTMAFLMLKHNEVYRYAKPELMAASFRDRIIWRRASACPTQCSRRPRNLNDIYRAIGLPQASNLHDLPMGERSMLKKSKLTAWIDQIHSAPSSPPVTLPLDD
jgi:hypothetical protein